MLLSDCALKYLVSNKLLDVAELKKLKRAEMPSKIMIRAKRKKYGEKRRQEFLEFVECYARYLLFRSKKHFKGLAKRCHEYQGMAPSGNINPHTGLIRCILGCKPSGSRQKQRRNVSSYYNAFSRLVKNNETPSNLASSGKNLTQILYPQRIKSASPQILQALGFKVAQGEYGLVLCRGTSSGKLKVLKGMTLGTNQRTALNTWQVAQKIPANFKAAAAKVDDEYDF